MSARGPRQRARSPAAAPPAAEGASVVQQVLAERRELLIANERLRLELEELRGHGDRPDPREQVLAIENRSLRDELASVRADLAFYEAAIARLVELLEEEKASP